MKKIKETQQNIETELMKTCSENFLDYQSLQKMIEAERTKKLRKGNHYIQQTIDNEIEKLVKNEN
ncbi:MAG: hypothetical protein IPH02_00500 [Sphingobacteriales bacterium]|nr:hypothetical protein [Sphingobacteriales bacterium]